ncbi:cellulose biosynthesis protein BcsD [Zavarzinia compransoris]|uniref:Cellulose synthase n=1 Tax=Zavarzinia compransoris TaxID=1264899 RepID=A0A317E2U5_9PROT|nr:cellulose biosynthesis protein BcsD [Zavarzinia compransoris]PWR20490.1 hypothetical protein DKG75_10810 [Zavarzinia compransoris]TDP43864.1 cellulose synthase subunit D [Zavarzinia compransoris]
MILPGRAAAPAAEGPEARYRDALFTEGALDPFFAALADEVLVLAGTEDAVAFMRQVGRRLASVMPLGPCDTLEALETAANQALRGRRWGWVRLAEVEAGIRISHGALPVVVTIRTQSALAALLEGLYSTWMHRAGGADHLQARHIAPGEAGTIDLLYGR